MPVWESYSIDRAAARAAGATIGREEPRGLAVLCRGRGRPRVASCEAAHGVSTRAPFGAHRIRHRPCARGPVARADRPDTEYAALGGERDARVARDTPYVESWGVLVRELRAHPHSGRPLRRNVHNTTTGRWRSQSEGAVSIRDRPPEVAERAVPGHWKRDLFLGRHEMQLATSIERRTRVTVFVQLTGRDMGVPTAGLSRKMADLPEHVRRPLT